MKKFYQCFFMAFIVLNAKSQISVYSNNDIGVKTSANLAEALKTSVK